VQIKILDAVAEVSRDICETDLKAERKVIETGNDQGH
jgi:hypothetical protein